ncbi:MAG: alpha-amylase family glycosyl hydrolase [Bacteroidota bacterium]
MKILTLLILSSIFLFSSCSDGKKETSNDELVEKTMTETVKWPLGVKYEIFVQSFCDSNGDGIGDIPGMTSKLDYIKSLGVNGVWLMPINPSPSYHKYDVTDYKAIHPDYGTLDDFKIFVKEAHQRGIRVIMDLVINHSSSQHPWFLEASSSTDNPFRDYYVWAKRDDILEDIAKKEVTMDSDNITQWHENDRDNSEELYYGFFYGGMPDLNYDNPKVRKEIFDIGKFWLGEVGVDGFRLDAAKHIYPDDRAEDNHAWWEEFRSEMQKANPDVYLLGEVWDDAQVVAPFLNGLPSLFNFDLAFSILNSVKEGKSMSVEIDGPSWKQKEGLSLEEGFIEINKTYKEINPNFEDAIFLSNHDQNRVMSFLEGNQEKAKVAAAILFTLPGIPYIYYGEELGMQGSKPDEHIREPFIWDNLNKEGRANWIKPIHAKDSILKGVEQQLKDPQSMLTYYRDWIELRNSSDVLSYGRIEKLKTDQNEIVAFKRIKNETAFYIFHNLSNEEISLNLPSGISEVFYSSNETSSFDSDEIVLAGLSTLILN